MSIFCLIPFCALPFSAHGSWKCRNPHANYHGPASVFPLPNAASLDTMIYAGRRPNSKQTGESGPEPIEAAVFVVENEIHPDRTKGKRNAVYIFMAKHHGGDPGAAQWAVNRAQEFSVFDGADVNDISDESGNLYGVLLSSDGGLVYLGTHDQQVAEFPYAKNPAPWHGYPLFPLKDRGPENRRGEKCRPDIAVFMKMEQAGLLGPVARKRLQSGRHVKKGRLA